LSNGAKQRTRGKALLGAFAISFAVYLIPLLNVHAGWMPLGVLWGGLATPSTFSFAVAAGAILFQAFAFASLYWLLRHGQRYWRYWKAIVFGILPLGIAIANLLFLIVIPTLVLVEFDTRPETGELHRVCTLPDATLAQVHSGTGLGLERAGEAAIILHSGYGRGRLTMPDCKATPLAATKMGSSMDHAAASGHLLYRANKDSHAYVGPGMDGPRPLANPPGTKYWEPILSDDGRAIAWLDRTPRQSGPPPYRLHLRRLDTGAEETIPMSLSPRRQFDLIGADTADGPFTLARHRNEILTVDRNGTTIRGPVSPLGIHNARWGFRWVADGWVAWDGYREDGASRVVWSLDSNDGESGALILPRGQGIESVAIAPDGRHIAVSMDTKLNLGIGKSAVLLLRTSDGKELYRRYHPLHSRVRLAFLGNDHIAMTRSFKGGGAIDVFRVPGHMAGQQISPHPRQ
jgi:hypothetical protein